MSARLIDGAAIAATVRSEVASRAAILRAQGVVPGLAVVLVGDDPPSHIYVRSKAKACIEAGMHSEVVHLSADARQHDLEAAIDRLNADRRVHGILCQLPLPRPLAPPSQRRRVPSRRRRVRRLLLLPTTCCV